MSFGFNCKLHGLSRVANFNFPVSIASFEVKCLIEEGHFISTIPLVSIGPSRMAVVHEWKD